MLGAREHDGLINRASEQARRMHEAAAGRDDDVRLELSVAAFRHLARMIAELATALEESSGRGEDEDSFARPIDGARWWVPAPELQRLRLEVDSLRREAEWARHEQWLSQAVAS